MKVTFLKAGGWGNAGGDRVIALHAENLQRMGHRVTVVAVPPPGISLKHRIRNILLNRVEPRSTSSVFDDVTFDRIELKRYGHVAAQDMPDADILITTWFETAEWAQHLPASKGRRVAFIQGYEAFEFIDIPRLDATWRLDQPKITISRWLFDLAHEKFGQRDVFLVPNSLDRTQFMVPDKARAPVPTIGFLYHTLYSKGVDVCLKVVERLAERYSSLDIVTFGHGAFEPSLPVNVGHRHFDNPPRGSIKDIYAQCDVWMCGSWSEGFGLTVVEAMACGCPVASTMVGGPLDFVVDGQNGYLVPIGDVDRLSAAVETVLDLDDDGWTRMSRQAAGTGADYSWEEASRRFEACLMEIARR